MRRLEDIKFESIEAIDIVSYDKTNYFDKWIREIKKVGYNKFVSFLIPLALIPLGIKAVKMGVEGIKKYKDKKKAEKVKV